ncbi:enoyl-CoA hydratase/isomerase family protein [Trinickia sp. LjRoot230]|uniref:enoyl-CoA hydratase/isomerase family protein n=1 Tax=Trinickia sp. LjRoot230 TaxID=3342288 RepID=UPI003ECD0C46
MATTESVSVAASDEVRAYVDNRIGFIELNRPKALNALSLAMIRTMHARLDEWRTDAGVLAVVVYSPHERAFCAGGDVRYFYEVSQRNDLAARDRFFIEEYSLDHAIFVYPKPYIALMDGIVMGGGMGISQGAHRTGGLRVVTDATQMAMPETRIGLFPDVGSGWFLARTPGAIGRYLAVTGATIGATDALYAGLADVGIRANAIPALLDALHRESFATGADVAACVKRVALLAPCVPADECADTSLAATRGWIDKHFGQSDVARIVASLQMEEEDGARDWAEDTIGMMRARSPLSMAVALEAVARGEGSMSQCLRRDLDLTRSMFEFGDVMEGVRAHIVDKDNRPVWRIAHIEDVSREDVERMFVSPWSADDHPLRGLHG